MQTLPAARARDLAETDWQRLVAEAQAGDRDSREELIAAGTRTVLRIGARLCGRYLQLGRDDEVSVGLLALNEAVDRWRADEGASFPAFAEMVVRRRLIDHFRREANRRELPWSEFDQADEDGEVWNRLEFARAAEVDSDRRAAEDRRADIERYTRLLSPYGISMRDLVRQSPRHADARRRAMDIARAVADNEQWREYLQRNRSLPLKALEAEVLGCSRKTIERQRKFIIAVAVILIEGLDALRPYLTSS